MRSKSNPSSRGGLRNEVCGCTPWLFKPAPHPNLCQFLDFNAAGPLTRPECGAGDESTPSGATGARESVHYVSRRSSWTPLLARLGGLLEVFSVMSTQLSAHIDSWILSLVFGNLLFVGKLSSVHYAAGLSGRSAARTVIFSNTSGRNGPATFLAYIFLIFCRYKLLLKQSFSSSFPIHRSYALLCSCVDADVKRTDTLWACPWG